MRPARLQQLRSGALVVALILLGISWSFTLAHVKTHAYPVLWAAALPCLALYYTLGVRRQGKRRHLTAGALSLYALVLWQAVHGYGRLGVLATAGAVLAGLGAVWLAGLLTPPEVAVPAPPAKQRGRAARRAAATHR